MANNGVEGTGVNWQIQMMPVRIGLQPTLESFDAGVAGLNYAVAEDAPISANAWGVGPLTPSSGANEEGFNQAMYDAINAARLSDHLFVAAAGNLGIDNDGPDPVYPASYDLDNIISVAALDENSESITNFGLTSVDLAAPGPWTSRGSSLTAGVAALLHSLHPEWSYSEIKGRILSTVDPLPSLAGKTVTGGRLNAAAAVSESSIRVTNPALVEGNNGTTDLVFTVSRSGDTSQPLTLSWSTADGTAMSGTDFVAAAGQLVFSDPLVTEQSISISVIGDASEEPLETMFLNLTLEAGTATLADTTSQGAIIDDDARIAITDVVVVESDDSGHYRGAFIDGPAGTQFAGLAFGPDGLLYTSTAGGAIDRYDGTSGAFIDRFIRTGYIEGVRDKNFSVDSLYIGSENTDEVLRFDSATGAFLGAFVAAGSGGIDGPHGLTFGPDLTGDAVPELYVTGRNSGNVVRYDGVTGSPLGEFDTSGAGSLSWPEGLTIGPDGLAYEMLRLFRTVVLLKLDGSRRGNRCPEGGR